MIAAYGCTTFLAVKAYFSLRRVERKMDSLHGTQRILFVMAIDANINENQKKISCMKRELQELIDNDLFEQAEELKKTIEERMRYVSGQIDYIRSEFGDVCEVRMYKTHQDKKED